MYKTVWYHLSLSRHHSCFTSLLIKRYILLSKTFTAITLLLSGTGGIAGWKLMNDFPTMVCIIIAVGSLIKLIGGEFIPSEKSITALHEIQDFYSDQATALDKLWFDIYHDLNLSDQMIHTRLNEILEKGKDKGINKKVNTTIFRHPKKLMAEAKAKTDQYLQHNY